MKPDIPPAQALNDLCRSAGDQATRWGTALPPSPPGPAGDTPHERRRRILPWAVAGAAVLAGMTGVVMVLMSARPGQTPPVAAAVAPLPPIEPAIETPPVEPVVGTPPAAAPAPPAARPAAQVRRQGGELSIEFDAVPLHEAITLLASATGTRVHGADLLPQATPVRLHWRGSDTGAAWQQLLNSLASFGIACSAAACEVWIVGPIGPPADRGTGIIPHIYIPPPMLDDEPEPEEN